MNIGSPCKAYTITPRSIPVPDPVPIAIGSIRRQLIVEPLTLPVPVLPSIPTEVEPEPTPELVPA